MNILINLISIAQLLAVPALVAVIIWALTKKEKQK
tara:strand:- start:616 stop:720 length:105 start_codon:yes stop_codon:yes gene_type:complete